MYGDETTSGRWLSPDPAGLAAADPANPQSWNRYAYVLNNPAAFIDPLGLDDCDSPLQPKCTVNVVGHLGGVLGTGGSGGDPLSTAALALIFHPGKPGGGQGSVTEAAATAVDTSKLIKDVNQCAAAYAGQHSLANELGFGDNKAANLFLGNDAATLSDLVAGQGSRLAAAGSLAVSNPTDVNATAATARLVGALPNPLRAPIVTGGQVSVTMTTVQTADVAFQSSEVTTTFSERLPTIAESALGKTLGTAFGYATGFKAVYDYAFYISGLAGCVAQGFGFR
jgi:uncharacterized protein RhaS with RHS repeats